MAFLSDKIKGTKATERYLRVFLRTESQQKAIELQQGNDVEGEEPTSRVNYYKGAANKLESIRKGKFFKGGKQLSKVAFMHIINAQFRLKDFL